MTASVNIYAGTLVRNTIIVGLFVRWCVNSFFLRRTLDKLTLNQAKHTGWNINQRKGFAMFVGRIFSSALSGIFLTLLMVVRIEAASVFEVRDVGVDATAKTAAKARLAKAKPRQRPSPLPNPRLPQLQNSSANPAANW
mgnify:CR=1 FL=1